MKTWCSWPEKCPRAWKEAEKSLKQFLRELRRKQKCCPARKAKALNLPLNEEHPEDGDRVGRKAGKSQPAPHPPASARLPHTAHPDGESNCPGVLLTEEPAGIPTPWGGPWGIRPTEPTEPPASCPHCPESSSH